MSRIISTITIFLVFITFHSQAQIENHIINIDFERTLKKMDFGFAEVVDKRKDKSHLGVIYKGRKNKQYQAVFEKGFQLSMTFMLAKLLPRSKDKTNLTFIFHEYSISESFESGNKIGICSVEVEFAKKIDGVHYSLGTFDAISNIAGSNITNKHEYHLFLALKECITAFKDTDWKDWNGTLDQENRENEVSINLANQVPQIGLYTSFKRLKSNQPIYISDGYNIRTVGEESKIPHYKIEEEGRNTKKDIDFISDEKDLYINSILYLKNGSRGKNHFVKIIEKGKYIYFEDRDPSTNSSFVGGVIGGVVGGALAAGLTSGMIGYVMDSETGIITRLGDRSLFLLISKHPEIVKTYRSSKRKLTDRKEAIMALNKTFE